MQKYLHLMLKFLFLNNLISVASFLKELHLNKNIYMEISELLRLNHEVKENTSDIIKSIVNTLSTVSLTLEGLRFHLKLTNQLLKVYNPELKDDVQLLLKIVRALKTEISLEKKRLEGEIFKGSLN